MTTHFEPINIAEKLAAESVRATHESALPLHHTWLDDKYERLAWGTVDTHYEGLNEAAIRRGQAVAKVAMYHGIGLHPDGDVIVVESPLVELARMAGGAALQLPDEPNGMALSARISVTGPFAGFNNMAYERFDVHIRDERTKIQTNHRSSLRGYPAERSDGQIFVQDEARKVVREIVKTCPSHELLRGITHFDKQGDVNKDTNSVYTDIWEGHNGKVDNFKLAVKSEIEAIDKRTEGILQKVALFDYLIAAARDGDLNPMYAERMQATTMPQGLLVSRETTVAVVENKVSAVPIELL